MKKLMAAFFALSLAFVLVSCFGPKECKHTYGGWAISRQVSCTGAGVQSRNCMKCGYLDSQTIEPLGHTEVVDVAKAATCSEVGLTEGSHCSACNAVITEQKEIPVIGHSYVETVLSEANCQTEGRIQFQCANCNDLYETTVSQKIYTATEIYNNYVDSVGEITTYNKAGKPYAVGTGFVYSSDGKIITNYHMIEGAYSAQITINNATYQIHSVLAYDKTIDIAVLKINATGLQELPICYKTHVVGQNVYAFGSSKGLTDTLSSGMITYSQRIIDGVHYVQHDAAISSGNSGGPLINQYGEIIGINTWTVQDSQNLNFAISMTELQNLRYDTPMTLEELFAETDILALLKAHTMSEGYYDRSFDEYSLEIGCDQANDGTKYTRKAYYYPEDDIFELCLWVDYDSYAVIQFDAIDGAYFWYYNDVDSDYMEGDLYAATFNENTRLTYTYHEISDANTRETVQKNASIMIDLLVYCIEADLSELGITALDFGFIHY